MGEIRERTREEKLKALVRKDLDPEITAMAEEALRRVREGTLDGT